MYIRNGQNDKTVQLRNTVNLTSWGISADSADHGSINYNGRIHIMSSLVILKDRVTILMRYWPY